MCLLFCSSGFLLERSRLKPSLPAGVTGCVNAVFTCLVRNQLPLFAVSCVWVGVTKGELVGGPTREVIPTIGSSHYLVSQQWFFLLLSLQGQPSLPTINQGSPALIFDRL